MTGALRVNRAELAVNFRAGFQLSQPRIGFRFLRRRAGAEERQGKSQD